MEDHARRVAAGALLAFAALAVAACGRSARRGEPLAGELVTTEAAQDRGRLVFMANCYKCHPGGEAGLGPSLNNRRVHKVHHAELKSQEVHDLMAYLAVLRSHSEKAQEPFEAREASR